MMKDTLIVLGSDLGTVDVVNKAQQMGLYVIVADLMETSPTKEKADEAWLVSTVNIDLLEERCKKYHVVGVMAGASELNFTNSRMLARRLGIEPYCADDYTWKVARDKSEFKKVCNEVGAPVAQGYHVTDSLSDEELSPIQYPVVVKPVDGSGNRGVSYCYNECELKEAYALARGMSQKDTIIVERKLHGPEWTVNYVLADGEASLLYFSRENHQPGESANLYSFMNTSPCHLKQYIEEVNDLVIKVFKKAGFREGIAWVEVMLDDDGHFYLIECGYRYGSDMSYTQYSDINGFDTLKWMTESSCGVKHTADQLPAPLNCAYCASASSYHLFTSRSCEILPIEGLDQISLMPNVIVDIPKKNGRQVKEHLLLGTIRVYGNTCEEMLETLKRVNSFLKVTDTAGKNALIYFTDYDTVAKEFKLGIEQFKSTENKDLSF